MKKRLLAQFLFVGIITMIFSGCSARTSPYPVNWWHEDVENDPSLITLDEYYAGPGSFFYRHRSILLTGAAKICQKEGYPYFSYSPKSTTPLVLTSIPELYQYCYPSTWNSKEWSNLETKCGPYEAQRLMIKGYKERPVNIPTFSVEEVLKDEFITKYYNEWISQYPDKNLETYRMGK